MVSEDRLWHLRVSADGTFIKNVEHGRFLSLYDLLKRDKDGTESKLSKAAVENRLVLSFVLTTSLLHLFAGPWLKKAWSNEDICFLVGCETIDPTKPFLTANCTEPTSTRNLANLNHVHPCPIILALGILLLEVSPKTIVKENTRDDDRAGGPQMNLNADGFVANRLLDEWVTKSRLDISKTLLMGLESAIRACIIPTNVTDETPPPAPERIRKYIFTDIVIPLGTASSTTYNVPLERLHERVNKWRVPRISGSYDGKHPPDQYVSS